MDETYISKKNVREIILNQPSRYDMLENIKSAPPADIRENIHGHWGRLTRVENVYSIDGVRTWGIKCQCDKCTFTTIVVEGFGFYDYCPHCGSRNEVETDMREPKEEKGTT